MHHDRLPLVYPIYTPFIFDTSGVSPMMSPLRLFQMSQQLGRQDLPADRAHPRFQAETADDLFEQAIIAACERKLSLDLDFGQAVHIRAAQGVERQRHTVDKVEEQRADVCLICLTADHAHLIRGLHFRRAGAAPIDLLRKHAQQHIGAEHCPRADSGF